MKVCTLLAFFPMTAQAGGLEVQPVTDGVWALVGGKDQRSAANLANNATFGVVVTDDGVVLIDPEGAWPKQRMWISLVFQHWNNSKAYLARTPRLLSRRWSSND